MLPMFLIRSEDTRFARRKFNDDALNTFEPDHVVTFRPEGAIPCRLLHQNWRLGKWLLTLRRFKVILGKGCQSQSSEPFQQRYSRTHTLAGTLRIFHYS